MATYTTTNAPLPWMDGYLQDYMARAQEVANTPYQQGPGTYTGPNDLLQSGWQMTANRAMQGSPEMSAARSQLTNTINGGFMGRQATANGGNMLNPYMNAGNPYAGQMNAFAGAQNANANAYNQNAGAMNPYANQFNGFAGVRNEAADVSNPYTGMDNPYLQQNIDNAQGDLARNFNLTNKPAWDKAMQSSGSFGNTGVAEMAQNDRNDLMKNMGRISSEMRNQAYNQSAQLAEARAGRQFSAGNQLQQNLYGAGQQQAANLFNAGNQLQQNLYGAGNQLAQNQFSAGNQLQQNLYGAGNQQAQNLYGFGNQQMQNLYGAGNQFAQNQFNAGADYAGRQDAITGQERGYQQSAMGMAPAFANQDYTDINNLMNAGGQQQQFNQQYQNQQQQFFNDARNFPQQQLDAYGRALGVNAGGTSTQTAPDPSTGSQLLGGALVGKSFYDWFMKPNP